MSNLRRSMMMAGRERDIYAGWQMGVKCTANTLADDPIAATSPLIPVNFDGRRFVVWRNCINNQIYGQAYYIQFLDGSHNVVASFANNNSGVYDYMARRYNITATMAQASYVRFCVLMERIDDAFLLDEQTNEYIWKGKKVR